MTTTRSGATTAGPAPARRASAGEKHKIEDVSAPPAKARKTAKKRQEMGAQKEIPRSAAITMHQQELKLVAQKKDGDTAVEPHGRGDEVASSILEKGIIYFFFRGRVDTDDPQGVEDIARTYVILRPIPKDAKLGEGPIGDSGNSRLCALLKKVFPQTGRDRWIAFVEKGGTTFDALKETFLGSQEYETKTAGTRHKPAATPAGEGVYAITSTGRESHLAYIMTLPDKLGEVQKELGLKEKGSFILSTRNPKYPPPKYAQLPEGPEYSESIMEEFHDLRWIGTRPEHLDIDNTQFLLIGESSGIEKAMMPQDGDGNAQKEKPIEEMEKLEDEDTRRMKHLAKDASGAIFSDLQVQARHYPKLQATF
ncbi:hypothetical protein GQ53DRAFT_660880 [Thozetella sp. PMI_491]|nr:hypothetical protein GQ53DRAFT_660880 [Thozetella sp. PMI_491]